MPEVLPEDAPKESGIRNWSKFLVHAVHLMEAERLELPCHLSAFSLIDTPRGDVSWSLPECRRIYDDLCHILWTCCRSIMGIQPGVEAASRGDQEQPCRAWESAGTAGRGGRVRPSRYLPKQERSKPYSGGNLFAMRALRQWRQCPEGLCGLCPRRFLKPIWSQPWVLCSDHKGWSRDILSFLPAWSVLWSPGTSH